MTLLQPRGTFPPEAHVHLGSNNWAVSGKRTADGRAMVADDMHLGIRVPHIWYRARSHGTTRLIPPKSGGLRVCLSPAQGVIVGSNGHVAWGFTNSEGDWVDVVIVDVDPNDKEKYLTPDGPREFEHHEGIIHVAKRPDEKLEVVSTIWGPVMDHDREGRPRSAVGGP